MSTTTSPLTIEDAICRIQEEEDEVAQEVAQYEKDVITLQSRLVLTGPIEQWEAVYARRLGYLNTNQRHVVKQHMYYAVTRLVRLYSEGEGEERALEELEKSVERMKDACAMADCLYAEVEEKYRSHARPLGPSQRALKACTGGMETLRHGNGEVLKELEEYKPSIMIICDKTLFQNALEALSSRRMDEDAIKRLAQPLFSKLLHSNRERDRLTSEMQTFTSNQTAKWRLRRDALIPCTELESVLVAYRRFGESVREAKARQDSVVREITDLAMRATPSKTTLPGPGNIEVPVAKLVRAATQYEFLRFRIEHTALVASSAIENLQRLLGETV